jgi:hypothetical protein
VLVSNQRVYHAQTQRIELQQNIRAATAILPAEFRELDAVDGDIQAMSPTSITIRAMRQLGVICAPPVLGGLTSGRVFIVFRQLYYGAPVDVAEDSLFLYYEGDESTRSDDGWVRAQPTLVANGVCPDAAASPGYVITANLALPEGAMLNRAGAVPTGAPMRGFRTITYKLYQATDGEWYLGLEPSGATVQPLVGPLLGANGLSYRYFDRTNAITAVPDSVAAIEITVRGRSRDRMHNVGQEAGLQYAVDSLTTRVTLRNNRRF